jgi:hypothetical protein
LRKIPVEKRTIFRADRQGKFNLKIGIFHKYPSQYDILNRYIMFGRGICEKYQSRNEKLPEPKGEGNLVSILVFFCKYPSQTLYICIITPNTG